MSYPAFLLLLGLSVAAAVNSPQKISLPKADGPREVSLALEGPDGGFGKHYAFPPIHDWKSLRIGLLRTVCLGACPDYSVEIRGDGSVAYNGRLCVAKRGVQSDRLAMAQVRTLFNAFRRADFFSLHDAYSNGVLDAPGLQLSLRYDGWVKNVVDLDSSQGLPAQAARLPDLIDGAVNSARWVGNPDPRCMERR